MGQVFRARDTRLDRDVALKVLPASALADGTARARLVREARLASKLNHPHICTVYDVGESDGQTYIGMELVEGRSLSDCLSTGPLPVKQVLQYGQQLADALAHAHGRGIVHRDLKSANVVVTPEGQVKVLDFGLAKRVVTEELTEAATVSQHTLTAPGMIAGTLAYMAPEHLRGEPADARSDVWALGIVLYEMAVGKRPFQGQTGFELTSAILSQPQPPLPGSVPGALSAVVDRCLEKNPGERYQRGEEVKAALEAVRAGTADVAAPHPVAPPPATRSRRWRWVSVALAMLTVIIGGLAALDVGGLRTRVIGGGGAPVPAVRLAVLPFANLGADPEQAFLADGMTQELITHLGRLNPAALVVIGRTSVLRYKDGDTPIDQIGRELGVEYVVGGSVQRDATHVRVIVELVRVEDQAQVWADTYEQELSGILMVQSQVTRSVASALAVALLPAEQVRLASARAVDPDVYEAYVTGASLWQSLRPADVDAAEQQFEYALERDPSYAPAHAGLAWVWGARNQMGLSPWDEAVPRAKEAALQAIALDEGAAEAHAALAAVKTWGEWDWPEAEQAWARAIELNPNDANTQAYYAHFLAHRGRAEDGLRHSDLAVELDPFNALYHALRAVVLTYLHRHDEAMEAALTAVAIRSDMGIAFHAMQTVYMAKGMHDEQLADQRLRISRDPERLAAFEKGLAEGGYEGAQRGIADVLAARYETALLDPAAVLTLRSRGQFHMAVGIAMRYLDAGDHDRAIAWLQKGYDQQDPSMPYTNGPPFDRLRDDPRYQALMRRIGIPIP
jgi:serine/threonine-protein kinase